MIPAPFDYEVAESVDHAIELLGRARTRSCSRAAIRSCRCCGSG